MECRVLVVDDDTALQYTFRELLTRAGYAPHTTGDPFEALKLLKEIHPHIAIVDLSMPKMDGLSLLAKLKELRPDLYIIMITAYGTQEIAVKAIKSGANDYFPKPFSNDLILLTLKNARARLNLEEENRLLREDRSGKEAPLSCPSPRMQEIDRMVDQIAPADVTVLLTGESGTGKEVVASAIYDRSRRVGRPFVKLNCAALPETLIESELFGHEVGAFTGAAQTRKGKFEQAHEGTLFLDEIGDMALATQTKVLRVLQQKEVERLGGSRPVPVDVRLIAATNQDLERRIQEGRFRADLYYRLAVVTLNLPPLRERREDIRVLAEHFLAAQIQRFGKPPMVLAEALLDRMAAHPWPGNVRELENAIARAVVLGDPEAALPRTGPAKEAEDDLMGDVRGVLGLSYKEAKSRILKRFERYYLLALMEQVSHNVSRAARLARMDRKNFWVKVKKYLPAPEGRGAEPPEPEKDDDADV